MSLRAQLRLFSLRARPYGVRLDRSCRQQQSLLGGFFSRIGKPHLRKPAESHLTSAATEHVTNHPTFAAVAANPQTEPRAIRVHLWSRGSLDCSRRQSVQG